MVSTCEKECGIGYKMIKKKIYFLDCIRYASKKTGGSTRNTNCKVKPKHRGWKVQDGHNVQAGHILATQRTTRFHPGLNVSSQLVTCFFCNVSSALEF